MKKSAIYVRVSTNYQIDKDSLPLQKNDMINYSKFVLGIDDYEIFEDAGYSGKNTKRPDFQNMMSRIKQGEFSHLLVWKIDRISRNLLDFCAMYNELKDYNCIFVSKNEQFDTSSAMGEAMLKIILVFAELERMLTGERVTATMIDRATKGLWNGAPVPLGYKWDDESKFPVIDPNESSTVELIYSIYQESHSTSIVRNYLNENGIKTKKDGTWTTKTISDIIRNPFYKGTYRYNYRTSKGKKRDAKEWILVEDNHIPIISNELWQSCNNIMDENALTNNGKFRDMNKQHIFASLIKCGECKNSFHAKQGSHHIDGYIPSFYACSGRYNKLGCNQTTISDEIAGNFIFTYISNIINISKDKRVYSLDELEKKILKGFCFNNIVGIEEIDIVYNSIYYSRSNKFSLNNTNTNTTVINLDRETLENKLRKYVKALNKLEDLYLFDEAEMTTKDYTIRKKSIQEEIDSIKKKINADSNNNDSLSLYDINFITDVLTLELSTRLSKGNIELKPLIQSIGRETLKTFINGLIKEIIVKDKEIKSIEFKNGVKSTFIYTS